MFHNLITNKSKCLWNAFCNWPSGFQCPFLYFLLPNGTQLSSTPFFYLVLNCIQVTLQLWYLSFFTLIAIKEGI